MFHHGGAMAYEHFVHARNLDRPYMQKLILFAIAARANEGGECAVSIDGLHVDTGLARRTVQLHLQALLAAQLVSREVRPGQTPRVRLPLPSDVHPYALAAASSAPLDPD